MLSAHYERFYTYLGQGSIPPFVLIHFQEDTDRELKGGYRQEKDGRILTYETFSEAKQEIKEWEKEVILGIVTSITANFSTIKSQVNLVEVGRSMYGLTREGRVIIDLKAGFRFGGTYISSPKSIEEFNALLEKSKKSLSTLNKDTCRHFYTALSEPDETKKFLSYFQFIERYTHSTYKSLNYEEDIQKAFNIPERLGEAVPTFFEGLFTSSKSLLPRFYWCSMSIWKNIESSDLESFREIKKVRDKLSHGEHIEELDIPVQKAKELALKLLGTK